VAPEIILHAVVEGREVPGLADPVQQSAALKHLAHRILQFGKQDFRVGLFRLGDQAQKRIRRGKINPLVRNTAPKILSHR
jgi:hypothetical protein